MGVMERLKSLNAFKNVVVVVNNCPFEIVFIISLAPVPPLLPPINPPFHAYIRPGQEVAFDPEILDSYPQYRIYVVRSNYDGNPSPRNAVQLIFGLVIESTKLIVELHREDEATFLHVDYQEGAPRTKARVEMRKQYRRMKKIFHIGHWGCISGSKADGNPPPPPPPRPPPPGAAAASSSGASTSQG